MILSPSGLPDYSIEIVNNEQVRKVKVNRPKALCFDYLQLKDSFGLELETEIISDRQEIMEDNQMGQKTSDAQAPDNLPQQDLPFYI